MESGPSTTFVAVKASIHYDASDELTYYFKYGTSPSSLTSQTSARTATPEEVVHQTLQGLSPGTTYYVRLHVQNSTGASDESDNALSFSTTSTGPPPPPPSNPPYFKTECGQAAGDTIFTFPAGYVFSGARIQEDVTPQKVLGCIDQNRGGPGSADPVHVSILAQPARSAVRVVDNDTLQAKLYLDLPPAGYRGPDQFMIRATSNSGGTADYTYKFEVGCYLPNGVCKFSGLSHPSEPTRGPFRVVYPSAFSGSASAGTVKVSKDGSFTLNRKVDCTGAGPSCQVANAVSATVAAISAKTKTTQLGSSKFTVKGRNKGAIKLKLTKKGLKLLKRNGKIKGKVKSTVTRGKTVTTKTFNVTLKTPKKAKKKKKK